MDKKSLRIEALKTIAWDESQPEHVRREALAALNRECPRSELDELHQMIDNYSKVPGVIEVLASFDYPDEP